MDITNMIVASVRTGMDLDIRSNPSDPHWVSEDGTIEYRSHSNTWSLVDQHHNRDDITVGDHPDICVFELKAAWGVI